MHHYQKRRVLDCLCGAQHGALLQQAVRILNRADSFTGLEQSKGAKLGVDVFADDGQQAIRARDMVRVGGFVSVGDFFWAGVC